MRYHYCACHSIDLDSNANTEVTRILILPVCYEMWPRYVSFWTILTIFGSAESA